MSSGAAQPTAARRVGLVEEALFLEHRPPGPHPENPDRLRAISARLAQQGLTERLARVPSRPASREELLRVHRANYLDELEATLPGRRGQLDADTYYSERSFEAARHAAGAAVALVEEVIRGRIDRGLALLRPPGHHAEPARAMGFCIFNNVAVAAAHARALGLERVLIYDWDLHHGNGTQDIFYADPSVYYASTHQYPYYPGTGAEDEVGEGPGLLSTLNAPLAEGAGDAELWHLSETVLIPRARAFRPELILISAGFDAHAHDPLGQLTMSAFGFARLAARWAELADEVCGGRMVAVLEGGYALAAVAESVEAVARVLLGQPLDRIAVGGHNQAPRPVRADVAALAERLKTRHGVA